METLKRTLSKTDAEIGRIYTSVLLPVDCSLITIECDDIRYVVNYNLDYYCITGLRSLHEKHNAVRGTVVSISETQEKNVFILQYLDKTNTIASEDQELCDLVEKLADLSCKNLEWFIGNETNVRSELVDPLLRGLGWNFPRNIFREVLCANTSKLADYALYNEGPGQDEGFCVVIETKSIDKIFKDENDDNVRQLVSSYMNDERFAKCLGLLTNGIQWWLLDSNEKKVIAKACINKKDDFVNFIKLFQYNIFHKDKIQQTVKGKFEVDDVKSNENKDFYINDNGEVINEKNVIDTVCRFVTKHINDIEVKDKQCCFSKKIIYDYAPARNRKAIIEHRYYDAETKSYKYITRDYGNYIRRSLVRQMIDFCNLEGVSICNK